MQISDFGKKLTAKSGILVLIDDLGKPLPPGVPAYRLGGGNPARVSEVEAVFREQMHLMLKTDGAFENAVGAYDAAQGKFTFLEALASLLKKQFGWNITKENLLLTSGSQTAFFYLFNLFSGKTTGSDGKKSVKKILFPLIPEYIGYADQGIEPNTFVSIPARCEYYDDRTFKYFIDFDALKAYLAKDSDVGALCVSRPTNPTGNVLTNDEVKRLDCLAKKYEIPLIIDNAYGMPFPHIVFNEEAKPFWSENTVLGMSLSKIGLPSLRTGIIIASKEIIAALSAVNAIAALAPAGFGPALVESLILSGKIIEMSQNVIRPFYASKSARTQALIHEFFKGTEYRLHKSEGAIFLWLYLGGLKISTLELYERLKKRGVVTVPGEYFFFGLPEGSRHEHFDKCLRLNYSAPDIEVAEGLRIIADLYRQNS